MDFSYYQSLPYYNKTHEPETRVREPIQFRLAKTDAPVTLIPVHDASEVPEPLIQVLHEEFNYVIEEGLTYPYAEPLDRESFVRTWFSDFVAILVEGHASLANLGALSADEVRERFLGNFYIKPNYAGRCSHVCNAGFIVNHHKRGMGLGEELGKKYLVWARDLGYVYSVFNLVFETNVASVRIWDKLGFERIGYVKNVAVLKGVDHFVGAYMFGKSLQHGEENLEK